MLLLYVTRFIFIKDRKFLLEMLNPGGISQRLPEYPLKQAHTECVLRVQHDPPFKH